MVKYNSELATGIKMDETYGFDNFLMLYIHSLPVASKLFNHSPKTQFAMPNVKYNIN